MYKKIIVPLDGSRTAERSLPFAEYLAGKFGSEVTLFSAIDQTDCLKRPFQEYLNNTVRRFNGQRVRTNVVVTDGNPAQEILRFACENNTDLIIICTHGQSGPGIWTLGSISAKVIQLSSAPVLLIRSGEVNPINAEHIFNKILLPLDGSKLAESIIPYVESLAVMCDSQVFPITVINRYKIPPVPIANYEAARSLCEYEKSLDEVLTKEASRYLQEQEAFFEDDRIQTATSILVGKPYETITRYAKSNSIGLIALTTHGLTATGGTYYGSTTSKILHSSSQPVLLVRPSLPAPVENAEQKSTQVGGGSP